MTLTLACVICVFGSHIYHFAMLCLHIFQVTLYSMTSLMTVLLTCVTGAFLIPYMIMICLIGMPLLFMEYGFGQYFGVGSLSIYKKVCPMFQGMYCESVCTWLRIVLSEFAQYLGGTNGATVNTES